MKHSCLSVLLVFLAGAAELIAQVPTCCPDPVCHPGLSDTFEKGNNPLVWVSADYLLWRLRNGPTPPLVVTGSSADPFPGALDQPGTQVLFGNQGQDYGTFNGLRLSVGVALDEANRFAVEASGFVLERRSVSFSAQGDALGQPFLAAPFVNANTGNPNVYFISQNFDNPNISARLTGGVQVATASRLWNWDVNGVMNVLRQSRLSADLIGGFRQLALDENLSYRTAASNLEFGGAASFQGTALDPGFTVSTSDRFSTINRFYGGQVGGRISGRLGGRLDPFTVEAVGKVALGVMHQRVSAEGRTTTDAPLAITDTVGGIYAQASNIGSRGRDVFAVVPEAGVNLCAEFTPNLKARVGYTFLYVSSVARPGDQIDTRINPNRVAIDGGFGTPGGADRPTLDIRSSAFWAQGVHFGLEFTY